MIAGWQVEITKLAQELSSLTTNILKGAPNFMLSILKYNVRYMFILHIKFDLYAQHKILVI